MYINYRNRKEMISFKSPTQNKRKKTRNKLIIENEEHTIVKKNCTSLTLSAHKLIKNSPNLLEMRGNRPYLCDAITSANLKLHRIELILWNFPRIFNRHWCLSGFLGTQKLYHDFSRRLGIFSI